MSQLSDPAGSSPFPGWSLWPLNLVTGLSPGVVARLDECREIIDRIHRGERPAGRLYRDDEMSNLFFISRRGHSAKCALLAFEQEAQQLGETINFDYLKGRENQLIIVAEVLALVGSWWTDCENGQAAAAVASSALRSAFWLWLEDDDRAMGVLRIALESLARLRTWLRNERKAIKLQSRVETTPRDWLDAAGWRRLQALNLALGELAHTRTNPRWGGARALLVQLLPPDVDPDHAPHQARGFSLDSIIELGAQVALEAVKPLSSELHVSLAGLMESRGLLNPATARALEDWLSRNWDNRSFDLGPGDFAQPSEAERARVMDELRSRHIARHSRPAGG